MPVPSSPESDFDSSLKAGHTREYAFHARRNAHEEKEYGKEEENFAPGELHQNDEFGFHNTRWLTYLRRGKTCHNGNHKGSWLVHRVQGVLVTFDLLLGSWSTGERDWVSISGTRKRRIGRTFFFRSTLLRVKAPATTVSATNSL